MTAKWTGVALLLLTLALFCPASAAAQQDERPTVQQRFAPKANRGHLHVKGAAPIRDDFYHSAGAGLDVGYYFGESLGIELRWLWLANWRAEAAEQVRRDTGFVPDARPQSMIFTAAGRYSIGYGKVLVFDDFVVHFDPQLIAGGGVALADGRVLPTGTLGMSVLTHYALGIQAKLDLQVAFQAERRTRGWVGSVSFLPTLGLGFSFGGSDEEAP